MLSATQTVHAARMETFNVQYVTALHDRCGTCLGDTAEVFSCIHSTLHPAPGHRDAPGYQNPAASLGTWLDINATRSGRIVPNRYLTYTRYSNIDNPLRAR